MRNWLTGSALVGMIIGYVGEVMNGGFTWVSRFKGTAVWFFVTLIERDFEDAIDDLDNARLQLLASLIANGTMDIKIAVTNGTGIYHDKLCAMRF